MVKNPSSLKRCGGQGDILVGISSLFSFWAHQKHLPISVALAWACFILRKSSLKAFEKHKLSLLAPQIIDELSNQVNFYYEEKIKMKIFE